MKNQGLFLVFILSLTTGLLWFDRSVREHFSDRHDLQNEISRLEEQKERDALKQALLKNQLEDLQAQAFQTLGQKNLLSWSEKQWFASLRGPASEPVTSKSVTLMVEAKEDFRKKDYAKAVSRLQTLIERYPTSKDIIEAHFLLSEALYLSGQVEQSLDWMDHMMLRYPESELTGFIMLRMAQILEGRNRTMEAFEVYETVKRQFPKSAELRSQVDRLQQRRPASL